MRERKESKMTPRYWVQEMGKIELLFTDRGAAGEYARGGQEFDIKSCFA